MRELLLARDLPVALGGASVDAEEIVAAIARDKKRLGGGASRSCCYPSRASRQIGCEVPDGELRAAVRELVAHER